MASTFDSVQPSKRDREHNLTDLASLMSVQGLIRIWLEWVSQNRDAGKCAGNFDLILNMFVGGGIGLPIITDSVIQPFDEMMKKLKLWDREIYCLVYDHHFLDERRGSYRNLAIKYDRSFNYIANKCNEGYAFLDSQIYDYRAGNKKIVAVRTKTVYL